MLLRDSEGLEGMQDRVSSCKKHLVVSADPESKKKVASPAIQLLAALASKDLAGLFCFDFTESAPPIKASS